MRANIHKLTAITKFLKKKVNEISDFRIFLVKRFSQLYAIYLVHLMKSIISKEPSLKGGSFDGMIWLENSLLVFLHAVVVDDAAPVQTEGEVIGVAVGIEIAAHVAWHIFLLGLDGLHVGGQLARQKGRGF